MSPVNRTSKWWLITGGSSGLGLSIAMAVLQAGDKVIATGRNVKNAARQHPEFEQLGGIWLQLDVTSSDAEQIVSKAIHAAGGTIDVLINNAGMLHLTSIEDARMDDVQDMFNTHVFGAIRVVKAVLPFFRAQNSGVIINMSSFSGITGTAGAGLYCMCKFALEGLSETLQRELSPFNIRVIILEPGAFRTSILKKATDTATPGIGAHYLDSAVGDTIRITQSLAERPDELVSGDPDKLGQRIVQIVNATGLAAGTESILRFPFGNDALHLIGSKIETLVQEFGLTKSLAQSVNVAGHDGSGASGLDGA